MKNVLLPLEGFHYHRNLLEFAAALNGRSKIMLTATLLQELGDDLAWGDGGEVVDRRPWAKGDEAACVQAWGNEGGTADDPVWEDGGEMTYSLARTKEGQAAEPGYMATMEGTDRIVVNHGARVKHYCDEHSIDCRVHGDEADPGRGVIRRELRFADLVLLSNSRFFEAMSVHRANAYIRKLLPRAGCPVLLVPGKPALPGEIILAYDGSASSVHAIRQFAFLFPEFSRLRTTLVCINDDDRRDIPEEAMIREWCEQHFKHFRACRLPRRTDGFYDAWLGMLEHPWLIAGGGRRADWSRLFEDSFVNRLVRTHEVPLFVARG